ncbi:hypothetical protein [Enterobacter hormaechei]|uniref:hypothetical protein n=1 Tax=Enterobacter hormaechei TaxID=158836 RepID=UPI001A233F41|nr:hypothetical protein [Enterobacter asburiae]HAT7511804.1 hypothetical protein [Enterobacter asburiae]HDR2869308.1 hypothetical protein [Enterobacter asburiae]
MEYQIEDITPYEDESGSGILACVYVNYEDHCKGVKVRVHLPLNREKTLAEIEQQILEEAKQQLKELVATF